VQATRMDTLWSVADALDVDAIELLANNSGIIDSPTVTLAGRTISICSVGECCNANWLRGRSGRCVIVGQPLHMLRLS